MRNLWTVSTDKFVNETEAIMRTGNVYQIANGYMGYRGTLDEFGPKELVGITLAGIYDRVGNAWREPVNAPNGAYTAVSLDGVELTARGTRLKEHRQTLHISNAVFERETTFAVRGKRLTVRSSRFLSADVPNLGVVHYSLSCDRAATVTIRTGIDANIWDLNGPHLLSLTRENSGGVLIVQGVTHENSLRVAVAEAVVAPWADEQHTTGDGRNLRVARLGVEPGKTYSFVKFFAVVTANDPLPGPVDAAAVAVAQKARAEGYEACLARHDAAWAARWERCDVRIAGDDEAQLALRYSILQLLMVAPVAGSANSIPARALSGQAYKGSIFWDTEMFMFPFFLHTYTEKAQELLRYRIRTLDGARRKAQTEGPGYRGAFYAWESQETGDDACSYFNIGDPFTGRDLRTHFRDKQVHISGDIAIAMWEYFRITGDDTLLLEGGAEAILECARFYLSYAYFKPEKDRYEILDVIGPDEYHERVNNNAFTSMVARETLAIASATIDHLRRRHPEALQTLVKKLGIENELTSFQEAANRLFVPAPDSRNGVIEQFDGYFQLQDTTIEALKARMVHPNEYLGAGQGLAVPTKIIKQADVVMMLNLFRTRFPASVKQANWRYYEPRTEHGSSLSACAYAIVATDFDDLDSAYKYFLKTATIDINAKYKVYVGTIFMGGSHPAANGGAWMTAVLGFGGVQADEKQVAINPRLYKKWLSLEFGLEYKGDRFRICITPKSVTIVPGSSNTRAHAFLIDGKPAICPPNRTVTTEYGHAGRPRTRTGGKTREKASPGARIP